MKSNLLLSLAITALVIAACSSSKKSTTSTGNTATASTPASTTPTVATGPLTSVTDFKVFTQLANGIIGPRTEELAALQVNHKEITLEKLKEGHIIYTQGACVNCHRPKNIYHYNEMQWVGIVDKMAHAAKISDTQKDAVYKYVLAIKATQPK